MIGFGNDSFLAQFGCHRVGILSGIRIDNTCRTWMLALDEFRHVLNDLGFFGPYLVCKIGSIRSGTEEGMIG